MRRRIARFAIAAVCMLPASFASASPAPQHPHRQSARPPASDGHHAARPPQPETNPTPAPAMPGPTAAQVLSGPLPVFPAAPSLFNATPTTYVPHRGRSRFNTPLVYLGVSPFAASADGLPASTSPASSLSETRTTPPVNEPAEAPQPSGPAPPTGPVTLYIVPGCYAGDRPPIDGMLPAGCDIAKMRTVLVR